jgi:hypothetical protein
MTARKIVAAVVIGLIGVSVGVSAWVNGHTVDLVVVNASGTPVEISWQPAPGAAMTSEIDAGCASHSLPISRGSTWRVSRDGQLILDSAGAALPWLDSLVAVEVWLDADGTTKIVPAHSVDRPMDAPYPSCSPPTTSNIQ